MDITYSSTQATDCAICGKHKHTPLRCDHLGGYVCLSCIDKQMDILARARDDWQSELDLKRDTPQTDAKANYILAEYEPENLFQAVLDFADFARNLEAKNAAMRAILNQMAWPTPDAEPSSGGGLIAEGSPEMQILEKDFSRAETEREEVVRFRPLIR